MDRTAPSCQHSLIRLIASPYCLISKTIFTIHSYFTISQSLCNALGAFFVFVPLKFEQPTFQRCILVKCFYTPKEFPFVSFLDRLKSEWEFAPGFPYTLHCVANGH